MLGFARNLLGGRSEESRTEERRAATGDDNNIEAGPQNSQTKDAGGGLSPVLLPLPSRTKSDCSAQFAGAIEEDEELEDDGDDTGEARGDETPGSRYHGDAECSPCAWFYKPQGCLRGTECGYCHLCPKGEVKLRKKQKLASIRSLASTPVAAQSPMAMPAVLEEPELDPKATACWRQPEPSVGSLSHGTGECRPCAWFWKPKGCQNGAECRHCHMCAEGEIRARKKAKADAQHGEDGEPAPLASNEPLKINLTVDLEPGLQMPKADEEPQKVCPTPTAKGGDVTPSAIKPPPGLAPPSSVPSAGSVGHGTGLCRPCAWLWKPQGCQNGSECRHCHLCPEGELKARRKVKAEVLRQEKAEKTEIRLADVLEGDSPVASMFGLGDPFKLDIAKNREDDSETQEGGTSPSKSGLGDADTPAFVPSSAPVKHVIPSEGSSLHGTGLCRPCAWFWKPKGCENGQECRHCHLCPEDEIKNRRKAKNMFLQADHESWSNGGMFWPAGIPPALPPPYFCDPGMAAAAAAAAGLQPIEAPESDASTTSPFGSPKVPITLANTLVASTGSSGKSKHNAMKTGTLTPKKDAASDSQNPRTVQIAPMLLGV